MSKKFFDICSGIGAAHNAFIKEGYECMGYSEIDPKAERTYRLLFGSNLQNFGDVMKINIDELPDFDLLSAGFPCQPFSIAGKREGIEDERGQIIFGIQKVIEAKKPKFFILENVKGLVNLSKGEVYRYILNLLEEQGYKVYSQVLDSIYYGTPQMRERIYIVGIRNDISQTFSFPEKENHTYNLENFLVETDDKYLLKGSPYETFVNIYMNNKYNKGRFNLDEILTEEYLVIDTRQSDMRLYRNRVPTIRTARQGILYVKNRRLRKLSGMESLILQGFNKEYAEIAGSKIPSSILLSQAGNAMTVNVMNKIAQQLV